MRLCLIRVLSSVLLFCRTWRSYGVKAVSRKDRSTFYGAITMIVTIKCKLTIIPSESILLEAFFLFEGNLLNIPGYSFRPLIFNKPGRAIIKLPSHYGFTWSKLY